MPPLLIGNIKSVVGHRCEVLLHSELKSMHVTHDGKLYSVGQLGSYVIVPNAFEKIVGVVTETRLLEVVAGKESEQVILSDKKVLKIALIGTITAGKFERGVREFPLVNDDVFLADQSDYNVMFGGDLQEHCVDIGSLADMVRFRVPLDVDKLISKPVAVVGTTGAGKSYTVARLLRLFLRYAQPSVLVLDLHGEYTKCFGNDARVLSVENGLEIPYWLFNYQELQDLCIDRNEREAPNQAVIFKQKVLEQKQATQVSEGLNLGDSFSIDSPIYFDLQNVYREIQRLNEEMIAGARGQKQGDFFGQFNRFLVRLEARLADYRYNFIFKPRKYVSSASFKTLLEEVFGRGSDPKKITVLDMSGMPSDVIQSVVSLLCRIIFDFTFWNKDREKSPLLLVCEEAHNYAARDKDTESRRAVERLAKEGRKYGLGLMVVSQRPSDLSETVLSQCNNFVVLRLSNPRDQEYIRALVTDQYEDLMQILPALRRGEALILGDAALMPLRVRIDPFTDASHIPHSQDVSFHEAWSADSAIDFDEIIQCWRKQRKSNSS
jgi:hypothetical protein